MALFIAALSGALFSAALPPLGLWILAVFLLPLMVLVARARRRRDAFALGFFFALAFFGLHLLWLPLSFVALFGEVAWIIYPPLIAALALMWGLVTLTSRWLGGYGTGTLFVLPAAWVFSEWLRSQGVFAFPWGFVGYVWVNTPLAQLADLAGVYGLSLLTLVVLSLFASLLVPKGAQGAYRLGTFEPASPGKALPVTLALSLLVFGFAYSGYRLGEVLPETSERALLVQGNTNPLYRVNGEEDDLLRHARLTSSALASLANGADLANGTSLPGLVIWPEGAVPWPDPRRGNFEEAQELLLAQLGAGARGLPVITGAGAYIDNRGYNSAFSVVGEQIVDRYDKTYLVPFGEFFPWQGPLHLAYEAVFRAFGLPFLDSRAAGEAVRPVLSAGFLAGVYICYESVFPQVPRIMVREGARVLSNISNDAWFGRGLGREQHFLMGSMRAIETRRYILRAGNDGITAVIDPLGRVLQSLPTRVEGTLLAGYNLRDDITPYVRYGDWLMVALTLYLVGFAGFRWWRT